ncbi:hypothetical protein [Clostridium sp.]|uniref:nitroreductase family protein n=1 Tax=Clostridium sp. TaxID=1506 RepID=UPI002FC7F04B
MKKNMKSVLIASLVSMVALTGCQGAKPTSSQNGENGNSLDVITWFKENENTWRTVNNGSWSKDPKDAPTNKELEQILETASKTQSAVGWTPYYFVAIRDPQEQKAIIGEEQWKGSTSEGTVTVLILADQIADQEHHKDKYEEMYMQTPVAYFDTGMACGLLNISAYSLGYSTHYFASPSGPSITPVDTHAFGFGQYPTPNYDLSRFIGGKEYNREWGLGKKKYPVEGNVVMIGAVVIGKPDCSIDAKTSVTQYNRPNNWTIWEPDKNTPPLK